MKLFSSYSSGLAKSFDFKGRTSRKDFWSFVIGDISLGTVIYILYLLSLSITIPIILYLPYVFIFLFQVWFFAVLLARWSLHIRRLRDMGRAWYWIFIDVIPIIGPLISIYWFSKPSVKS